MSNKIGFKTKAATAEFMPVKHKGKKTVEAEEPIDLAKYADMIIAQRLKQKAVEIVDHYLSSPFPILEETIEKLKQLRVSYKACKT